MSWKGKLIACGNNAKTIKGDGSKYLTAILYMKPYKVVADGKTFNSCSMADQASCVDGCLNTAGRGQMNSVQDARERKALWFYTDRDGFMAQLVDDVIKFVSYCSKRGIQPCIRLNGTTDIRWELIKIHGLCLMEMFPQVQWYDYTKIPNRKVKHLSNYHLTWSYSAARPEYARMLDLARKAGMNVAVVFRDKQIIPNVWQGMPTVDGDADDLRFKDPAGVCVALYAKGDAKRDTSGFVQD